MLFSLLTVGLFAAAATATPTPEIDVRTVANPCLSVPCMTSQQATTVANNFASLISAYSAANANKYLTPGYTDYSDSVIELINSGCTGPDTLGNPVFTSRAAFEAGQSSQPNIPFTILNLWYTCDTVFIRWRTTPTPGATEEVTGIIVLETEFQQSLSEPWLINTVYSEFNSGAWLVDLGVFKPTCT